MCLKGSSGSLVIFEEYFEAVPFSLSLEDWLVLSGAWDVASPLGTSEPRPDSVCSVSSDEPPPVPLPLLLFLGSLSSTTVTRRPGSLRRTLADGECSGRPSRTSPSADWRLRGDREREHTKGGDRDFWSLLS